jgi:hypothetical protein
MKSGLFFVFRMTCTHVYWPVAVGDQIRSPHQHRASWPHILVFSDPSRQSVRQIVGPIAISYEHAFSAEPILPPPTTTGGDEVEALMLKMEKAAQK